MRQLEEILSPNYTYRGEPHLYLARRIYEAFIRDESLYDLHDLMAEIRARGVTEKNPPPATSPKVTLGDYYNLLA